MNLIGAVVIRQEIVEGEQISIIKEVLGESCKTVIFKYDFSEIPRIAKLLDRLKDEKAKTIVPKFKKGDVVNRDGYCQWYGEIEEIEIEIRDDGEELITYTIDKVGMAWESELELTSFPLPDFDY